jgi:hypothetical protein
MPTKTTELEAVNTILSAVGEPPIVSLTGTQGADAAIARNILNEVSREVQSQGWHFNTLYDQTFSPNSSNEIVLADEVLRVDNYSGRSGFTTIGDSSESRSVVQRGDKLFDKTNNTFTFTSSIKMTVVYLYDFEEMPEPARRYVTIKAARIFQDRMVGSQKSHVFTMQDEMRCMSTLKEFEGDTADRTIFDNNDVFNIVNRKGAMRRGSY